MTDKRGITNHIAEWYGHRVYPMVAATEDAYRDQKSGRCPFLTAVTGEDRSCIKKKASHGVCTISSTSNGERQDWLVCPIRVMSTDLLAKAAERLFGHHADEHVLLLAAPALNEPAARRRMTDALAAGKGVVVYFQAKAGGEIGMTRSDRSPEFSFDFTMVEVLPGDMRGDMRLGRYGILEVQTMDFHGTYRHAVRSLQESLRLFDGKPGKFHQALRDNPDWGAERVEGPNIANVFKRTFYQMMFKFQLGLHESCAGTVLALPRPVWDSWGRHLSSPSLAKRSDGTWRFEDGRATDADESHAPAWIYVFEIVPSATTSPNDIQITHVIATDAPTFSYLALERAPRAALEDGGAVGQLMATIEKRLGRRVPELRRRGGGRKQSQ